MTEKLKPVISYEDDVFVWVYLDQVDRLLRYEAFVVDYDAHGRVGTLKFVVEEGVLDNAHEVPLIDELIKDYEESYPCACARQGHRALLAAPPSLRFLYPYLSAEQMKHLHAYFARQEGLLKRHKKVRWMRSLRALGFDVVGALS
jgi:hypothetical protein